MLMFLPGEGWQFFLQAGRGGSWQDRRAIHNSSWIMMFFYFYFSVAMACKCFSRQGSRSSLCQTFISPKEKLCLGKLNIMKKKPMQLLLLAEMQKFIRASVTGRRLMPSGKKISKGTIEQYQHIYNLLKEYEASHEPLRIQLLNRCSFRVLQQEKNYWFRFFRRFSQFMYRQKHYYDHYSNSVFKVIRTLFNYLISERGLPIGEFHRRFRSPA